MAEYVDFHYTPLEGRITGKQVLKQTEDAINDLGNRVYDAEVTSEDVQEALDNSQQAIDIANDALAAVTTDKAVWFNNVADMKAANLVNGNVAATKGYTLYNDGNGAFYAIRQKKGGDVDDGVNIIFLDNGSVAERINEFNLIAKKNIVYATNVAELKSSDGKIGSVFGTLGYYTLNDGGSSVYAIRAKTQDDVDDGGSIIFLNNGNVAELITDGTVSVKQFGAYGDGTHDDILAIQTAIDTGMPVRITEGTYKTTAPIQIVNKRHIEYDWTNSIINYTGNDCGLYITNAENLSFNIGQLFAYNGDAIKLVGTDLTDWVQYININFDMLRANATTGSCIRGEISGTSWVNEIRINHGRLIQGKYGCLIHRESGTIDNTNHWNFINVGFEGVDIGTFFNNESSVGIICGCIFVGCRYNETRAKLIKSIGKVKYITFFGADSLTYSWFDLDSGADQWQLYEDADNYIYTSIYNGRIYPHGEFMSVAGGRSIESNSDLNDIVIPGSYTVVNNSTASSLSNCPTTVAFRMTISVINGSFTISNPNGKHLLQEIIDLNGDVYTRKFGYDYNDGTKTFLPWRKFSYAKKSTTNQLIVHRVAATFNSFNAYDEGSWRKIVASITFGEVTEGGGDVYISIYNCIADTALGILFVSDNVYFLRTAGNNSMWLTKSDGQRVPASELVGKTGKLHIDCVIS